LGAALWGSWGEWMFRLSNNLCPHSRPWKCILFRESRRPL
jgi:hypothetical protein